MKQLKNISLYLLLIPFTLQLNGQFSWIADPVNLTVGYNYLDAQNQEQQASIWQPGALNFWTDDNYDTGSLIQNNLFQLSEYNYGLYVPRLLSSRLKITSESLTMEDGYGPRFKLKWDEILLNNSASYHSLKTYIRGNSGQLDLFSGTNGNYLARLGATSENSYQGALDLFDENGIEKASLNVTSFNEGLLTTVGSNSNTTTILGSLLGNSKGYLALNNDTGTSQMQLYIDGNNEGQILTDHITTETIQATADGSDFAGSFDGGKGVKIRSLDNSKADLVLQGNDASEADGTLISDPNFPNSALRFKSNGYMLLHLDQDGSAGGNTELLVFGGSDDIFSLGKATGARFKMKNNVINIPHVSITEKSDDGYARMNMKNESTSQFWQIAAKQSGDPAYMIFHFSDVNGGPGYDILRLQPNGDAWLKGALTQHSDRRLKTNIQPLSNVLPSLLKLQAYKYNWKDGSKSKEEKHLGLLAQELKEIFPNLVAEDDKGLMGVNYVSLIPILIESLKEQNVRIDKLESIILRLEKELD